MRILHCACVNFVWRPILCVLAYISHLILATGFVASSRWIFSMYPETWAAADSSKFLISKPNYMYYKYSTFISALFQFLLDVFYQLNYHFRTITEIVIENLFNLGPCYNVCIHDCFPSHSVSQRVGWWQVFSDTGVVMFAERRNTDSWNLIYYLTERYHIFKLYLLHHLFW